MPISQSLLPELDQEMAKTRTALERIPDDRLDYKPHEKSMVLKRLAGHLAELPGWGSMTLTTEELDIAPVDRPKPQAGVAQSSAQAVAEFDKNAKAFREALAAASDEHLMRPWTLKAGGNALFTIPRIAVIRSMVMNHVIHHRAQLGVYLRLLDISVPSTYGPSADEGKLGG